MSKEECVEKLNETGFKTCLEDGVVMITIQSESERARAGRAVKELGLRGSWGTRGINDWRGANE